MFSGINRFFSKFFSGNTENSAAPAGISTSPSGIPGIDALRDQIEKLVANGKTGEALKTLIEAGYREAILIKAQLDSAQAQFDEQKIKFKEWSQIQARVSYAILSFFKKETEPEPQVKMSAKRIPDVPVTEQQRTEIRQLVLNNQTEEAFVLCEGLGVNFVLTNKRFYEGKKHFLLGLIDEEEWAKLKKQIDEALLFFLEQHPEK